MKKLFLVSLMVVVIGALIFGGCAAPAPAPAPTPAPTPAPAPAPTPTTTPAPAPTPKPAPAPTPAPGPAPAPAPAAATFKFSYADFFPPTHLHAVLYKAWSEEIGKRTNGRVQITYYPGGTLAVAAKIYDATVSGIADLGTSCFSYTMGRFPAFELVDLPHGYPNGWVATKVANDYYAKVKPAEVNDTHLLYVHAHGPGTLHTTKKPVRKLEDVKGMVIRGTGVGAKVIEFLGGKGYGASQPEAYELLSKGVVDGTLAPPEVLKGYKQAEVIKYTTQSYGVGYSTVFFVTMNKDKWNKLPADIQDILTKTSQEWAEKHAMVWNYIDDEGIVYFKSFPDREVIELPKEEMDRWVKAATEPMINEYIAQKKALGIVAEANQAYILEQVASWSPKTPSAAQCKVFVEGELLKK